MLWCCGMDVLHLSHKHAGLQVNRRRFSIISDSGDMLSEEVWVSKHLPTLAKSKPMFDYLDIRNIEVWSSVLRINGLCIYHLVSTCHPLINRQYWKLWHLAVPIFSSQDENHVMNACKHYTRPNMKIPGIILMNGSSIHLTHGKSVYRKEVMMLYACNQSFIHISIKKTISIYILKYIFFNVLCFYVIKPFKPKK